MKRTVRRTRSGQSLIEALVYITLIAVALSFAMRLMNLGYDAHRSTQAWGQRVTQHSRLARSLTRDVHAAAAARLLGREQTVDQHRLQLDLPDGTAVHYAWSDPWVTRIRLTGDQVVEQEAFQILTRRPPVWDVADDGRLVTVQLFRTRVEGENHPYRVEAVVGHDLRYRGGSRE